MGVFRAALAAVCLAALALPAAGAAQEAPPPLQATLRSVGDTTFEPTIGVDGAGRVYFSVTRSPGVAIGWRPGMMTSSDKGETWRDITPRIDGRELPVETNDPFIYVDQQTGRLFNFHMSPIFACSTISTSDDQGATWFTNPLGCGFELPYDHQTIVASKPRVFPTNGYPNLLLQCVNSVHSEECARSLDGGHTWTPLNPAYPNVNATHGGGASGTQTGHLAAAPDGTIYLPTSEGGYRPVIWSSDNDGLTWTRHQISDMAIPFTDPAIAVDEQGVVYAAFVDGRGQLFYTYSSDKAVTWKAPVMIGGALTTTLPALDVGDPGRVVIAAPGTAQLPDGFQTASGKWKCPKGSTAQCVGWDAYLFVSGNALDATPTFAAVKANSDGPLFRGAGACVSGGRCDFLTDFIDVTVGPDGMPYAAFSRGCTGTCATDPKAKNNLSNGIGVVATLTSGVPLCAAGCNYKFRLPAG